MTSHKLWRWRGSGFTLSWGRQWDTFISYQLTSQTREGKVRQAMNTTTSNRHPYLYKKFDSRTCSLDSLIIRLPFDLLIYVEVQIICKWYSKSIKEKCLESLFILAETWDGRNTKSRHGAAEFTSGAIEFTRKVRTNWECRLTLATTER